MPATIDKPRDKVRKTPPQPPYAVLLHNDDVNTMEFVVGVLRKVFSYPQDKCEALMKEAHEKGKAVVWTGMREVAELKAEQIQSCGADPARASAGAKPLRVTLEPMG